MELCCPETMLFDPTGQCVKISTRQVFYETRIVGGAEVITTG